MGLYFSTSVNTEIFKMWTEEKALYLNTWPHTNQGEQTKFIVKALLLCLDLVWPRDKNSVADIGRKYKQSSARYSYSSCSLCWTVERKEVKQRHIILHPNPPANQAFWVKLMVFAVLYPQWEARSMLWTFMCSANFLPQKPQRQKYCWAVNGDFKDFVNFPFIGTFTNLFDCPGGSMGVLCI